LIDPSLVSSLVKRFMKESGLPVPAPKDVIYRWATPLGLEKSGRLYLFTGGMYQLMPYINAMVGYLEKLESSRAGKIALGIAGRIAGLSGITKAVARPDKRLISYSESVLRSISRHLKASGVEYAYLYEDDMYSGVILYDLGLDEEFTDHALRVYKRLRERGVESIITVDPHTKHMMRSIYPKYIDGYSINVESYLEVLDERGYSGNSSGEAVIHDPCLYARFEGVLEQPRNLLRRSGLTVREPRRSGRMTYCCGGPIEGLAPSVSKRIARMRMDELRKVSNRIIVMCPICYSNLSTVAPEGVEVTDISLTLGEPGA